MRLPFAVMYGLAGDHISALDVIQLDLTNTMNRRSFLTDVTLQQLENDTICNISYTGISETELLELVNEYLERLTTDMKTANGKVNTIPIRNTCIRLLTVLGTKEDTTINMLLKRRCLDSIAQLFTDVTPCVSGSMKDNLFDSTFVIVMAKSNSKLVDDMLYSQACRMIDAYLQVEERARVITAISNIEFYLRATKIPDKERILTLIHTKYQYLQHGTDTKQ